MFAYAYKRGVRKEHLQDALSEDDLKYQATGFLYECRFQTRRDDVCETIGSSFNEPIECMLENMRRLYGYDRSVIPVRHVPVWLRKTFGISNPVPMWLRGEIYDLTDAEYRKFTSALRDAQKEFIRQLKEDEKARKMWGCS